MEFAPIVPIRYLNKLAGLSHYHLVLAHWLVNKNYFNFYKKTRDRGDFIILDNGCCELGESLPMDELMNWYKKLGGVHILVIPDTTVRSNIELALESWDYLDHWFSEELTKAEYLTYRGTEFMIVPHNLDELKAFLSPQLINKPFSYIGLNRGMEEDYGRANIIEEFKNCGKRFHLLGFYRNPKAETEAVRQFGNLVIGIDSSVPYSIASRGRLIEEYRPYPTHLNLNDKPSLDSEVLKHCGSELAWFINWVRGDKNV